MKNYGTRGEVTTRLNDIDIEITTLENDSNVLQSEMIEVQEDANTLENIVSGNSDAIAGFMSHKCGTIKAVDSDDGDFTNIDDWVESGNMFYSTITHGLNVPESQPFKLNIDCYQLVSGTVYNHITPSQIDTIDNTKIRIHMPYDYDLYVSIIG